MGTGQPFHDMAQLLGGGMLLFSFVMLYRRRVSGVIGAFAAQAALLALALMWQGWAQGAPGLYLAALLAAAKAVLLPLALRRLARRLGLHPAVEPAIGIGAGMAAGVALVALALAALPPSAAGALPQPRGDLAIPLSVVLLGLLMTVTRHSAISQVLGLLSLENGLALAASGLGGAPLVPGLSAASLALALAVVGGFLVFRRHGVLPGPDAPLPARRGAGREGEGA